MLVDSGASTTVVNEDMVSAVNAINVKPDVTYQMPDGRIIPHQGEKTFKAVTDEGLVRHMTAQVCDVDKPLLSVSKMVKAGHTVVFDTEGSYIENKSSGVWIPLEERNGLYTLKMWIPKDQASPF